MLILKKASKKLAKIGKKRQKAAKIPSKTSKFCIFIKSLKSVAYAIKTFKTSNPLSFESFDCPAAAFGAPAFISYHKGFYNPLIISCLKN
jgi:hypothetical protein